MARVLVIDDDVHTCKLLQSVLRGMGCEVIVAHDGRDGLERFAAEPYELVICDLFLPEIMGYDVCRQIRLHDKVTPILSMSGICRNATDAENLGIPIYGDDFIAKPLDLDDLQRRIGGILQAPAPSGEARSPFPAIEPEGDDDEVRERWASVLAQQVVEAFTRRRSGALRLVHGDLVLEIAFANGFPVDVAAPFQRENLGRFLLREGRMNDDEYQRALHVAVQRRLSLEDILIELGLVESSELVGLERAQKREALIATFAWGSGSWEFKDGEAPTESAFQLNPSTLVLDGVRRGFPAVKLEKRYASRAQHLLRTGPRFQQYLTLFAPFLYRTGLHAAVGGGTTVGAALATSGGDRLQALALLRTLELLRVVEIVASTAQAPADGNDRPAPGLPREVAQSAPPAPLRPGPKLTLDDLLVPDAGSPATGQTSASEVTIVIDDDFDDAPAVMPPPPRFERAPRTDVGPVLATPTVAPKAVAPPHVAALDRARTSHASEGAEPPPPEPPPEEPQAEGDAEQPEGVDTRLLWQELSGLRGADHYAILGIDDQANDAELRDALFEKLARWRPDRPGVSAPLARPCADMTARIAAAYGALADPELRRVYDARRRGEAPPVAEPAVARPTEEPSARAAPVVPPPSKAEDPAEMYIREGRGALDRSDYATALHAFDEARRTRPDDAELCLLAGLARYRHNSRDPNNIQEAVRDIMRSTELEETDNAYFQLGLIFREQGLTHKAKQMFGRAVNLNPANAEARRALEALGGVAA